MSISIKFERNYKTTYTLMNDRLRNSLCFLVRVSYHYTTFITYTSIGILSKCSPTLYCCILSWALVFRFYTLITAAQFWTSTLLPNQLILFRNLASVLLSHRCLPLLPLCSSYNIGSRCFFRRINCRRISLPSILSLEYFVVSIIIQYPIIVADWWLISSMFGFVDFSCLNINRSTILMSLICSSATTAKCQVSSHNKNNRL